MNKHAFPRLHDLDLKCLRVTKLCEPSHKGLGVQVRAVVSLPFRIQRSRQQMNDCRRVLNTTRKPYQHFYHASTFSVNALGATPVVEQQVFEQFAQSANCKRVVCRNVWPDVDKIDRLKAGLTLVEPPDHISYSDSSPPYGLFNHRRRHISVRALIKQGEYQLARTIGNLPRLLHVVAYLIFIVHLQSV